MKKYLLIGIVILAGLTVYAQDCGNNIDLLGIGIATQDEASINFTEFKQVDSILVEAIYKSTTEPSDVKFSSDGESIIVSPVDIPLSGTQGEGYYTSVFRAMLVGPTTQVSLDYLDNISAFYSFALYIYHPNGGKYSIMAGDLYHVYQNEDENEGEALVTDIPVPVSTESRDINLRFGITEMNDDERIALFTFQAGEDIVKMEIKTWKQEGGSDSYIIKEVLFEDVPGKVDNITMTMLSNIEGGDSFIAGVVVLDLPCEEYESSLLCSYTQGYYGNEGGKTCDGKTTRQLLEELLASRLVMGKEDGYTFTIAADHVDCVLRLLPGGGPPSSLSEDANCEEMGSIATHKQERLKNTLLAQGITLALNVRLSPDLMSFPADGTIFVTRRVEDCLNPESGGIPGTEMKHAFSQEIVDKLGDNQTIGGVLNLVNEAIAGMDISPLSLSQVADAANLVNEAFDECVAVLEYDDVTIDEEAGEEGENDDPNGKKGLTGISDKYSEDLLGIYPNPVRDRFYLSIPDLGSNVKSAGIYSITGLQMKTIELNPESGMDQIIEIEVGDLLEGIYFVRIETEAGSTIKRFAVQ